MFIGEAWNGHLNYLIPFTKIIIGFNGELIGGKFQNPI